MNNRYRIFLFVILLSTLVLNTGCARLLALFGGDTGGGPAENTPLGSVSPEAGSPDSGGGYFPNVDGYVWTYNAYASATPDAGTATLSFTGSSSLEGYYYQNWTKSVDFGDMFTDVSTQFVRVTSTWMQQFGENTRITSEAQIKYFAFPLSVGKTWVVNSAMTADARVQSHGSASVEGVTYTDVYKIVLNVNHQPYLHWWVAKDVGLIKFDWSEEGEMVTYELTSTNFRALP